MRRYIITGAPGAGKTTVLTALRDCGYAVVDEAATDVNVRLQARGREEPWRDPGFIDSITLLQRDRWVQPAPPATAVQVFDRSPICTLALARYLGLPVTPILGKEIERVVAEGIYQPRVFFVHLLVFITQTAVRRISLAQSVTFERFHEQAYRNHGFELVDVPAGPVEERVKLIDACIRHGPNSSLAPPALPSARPPGRRPYRECLISRSCRITAPVDGRHAKPVHHAGERHAGGRSCHFRTRCLGEGRPRANATSATTAPSISSSRRAPSTRSQP
jgi:predicted ATPase